MYSVAMIAADDRAASAAATLHYSYLWWVCINVPPLWIATCAGLAMVSIGALDSITLWCKGIQQQLDRPQ